MPSKRPIPSRHLHQKTVTATYSEREEIIAVRSANCRHRKIRIVKYSDSSVWIICPDFGWYESDSREHVGCKRKRRRCTWFFG